VCATRLRIWKWTPSTGVAAIQDPKLLEELAPARNPAQPRIATNIALGRGRLVRRSSHSAPLLAAGRETCAWYRTTSPSSAASMSDEIRRLTPFGHAPLRTWPKLHLGPRQIASSGMVRRKHAPRGGWHEFNVATMGAAGALLRWSGPCRCRRGRGRWVKKDRRCGRGWIRKCRGRYRGSR